MKLYESAMQQQIKLETRQTITQFYSYQINLVCSNENNSVFLLPNRVSFDSIKLV